MLAGLFHWLGGVSLPTWQVINGGGQALFDGCLVLVAFIQIKWMRRTIKQMNFDREQREKFDKEHQRARIRLIKDEPWLKLHEVNDLIHLRISVKYMNIGQSAAINIFPTAEVFFLKHGEKFHYFRDDYHNHQQSSITLMNGASNQLLSKSDSRPHLILPKTDFVAVTNKATFGDYLVLDTKRI